MKENHDIKTICGAVIALTFAIPVLDGIATFVTSALNRKINQWQIEFQKQQAEMMEEEMPTSNRAIGFAIDDNEWEEGCEDEDDK